MHALLPYDDYTREDVHDIFDPDSVFTPQAGTWGLQGIVKIPGRRGDYVFFVTFGKRQSEHEFDEGITIDGVLRWQSQPKQKLNDRDIQELIRHDEDSGSIYLFLRTAAKRNGIVLPYTYLGRLKYLTHDNTREKPVYFTWQILDWDLPEAVVERMALRFEAGMPQLQPGSATPDTSIFGLTRVPTPRGRHSRAGLPTPTYANRTQFDHAEQDAKNRRLGRAGEMAVIESERKALVAAGRPDLADRILHVAEAEGDGAGYDIRSFTPEGETKFIEVKTTEGGAQSAFYLSVNEVRFSVDSGSQFYLYRVFDFDLATKSGKVFVQRGALTDHFSLKAVQFKAVLLPPEGAMRPPSV